jgi:hypothetical protein
MQPNITFIARLKAELLAHPDEYDQEQFRPICGTGCCIAGHAYLLAGHTAVDLLGAPYDEIIHAANKAMGFTLLETLDLFSMADLWPKPFAFTRRAKIETKVQRACKYLDALVRDKLTEE